LTAGSFFGDFRTPSASETLHESSPTAVGKSIRKSGLSSCAPAILITADCGGSNGARVRLWKTEVQTLADQIGLSITVAHLPP
jgi:hypothetical protein